MHDLAATALDVLLPILVVVATTAIGALANAAIAWLGSLSRDRRWAAAIGKLDIAASGAVEAVEQTLVAALRNRPTREKLTRQDAHDALASAIGAAKQHIGPSTWAEIATTLEVDASTLEDVLRTRIEAAVLRLKHQGIALPLLEDDETPVPVDGMLPRA